jgi:hypothetical protein
LCLFHLPSIGLGGLLGKDPNCGKGPVDTLGKVLNAYLFSFLFLPNLG